MCRWSYFFTNSLVMASICLIVHVLGLTCALALPKDNAEPQVMHQTLHVDVSSGLSSMDPSLLPQKDTTNAPLSPPLVVIRLNQENLYIDDMLGRVTKEALRIDPSVGFAIMAFSVDKDASSLEKLRDMTERARYVLYQNGVSPSHMDVSFHHDDLLLSNEVHIYLHTPTL